MPHHFVEYVFLYVFSSSYFSSLSVFSYVSFDNGYDVMVLLFVTYIVSKIALCYMWRQYNGQQRLLCHFVGLIWMVNAGYPTSTCISISLDLELFR